MMKNPVVMKARDNSFYLKSNSANINCYWKHYHLKHEFDDCPNIDDALNVIRFEVQCLYPKVYTMSRVARGRPRLDDLFHEMLSDEVCASVIHSYFVKVIRMSDYYTLSIAKSIIGRNFKRKKADRLIKVLSLINTCRGISKAKATLADDDLEEFRRSLRDLASINVNPVTIPREWGIKRIPNLLGAYYEKLSQEQNKERDEQFWKEMLEDYRKKKRRKKEF